MKQADRRSAGPAAGADGWLRIMHGPLKNRNAQNQPRPLFNELASFPAFPHHDFYPEFLTSKLQKEEEIVIIVLLQSYQVRGGDYGEDTAVQQRPNRYPQNDS